jgi:glucan-binding YG repeat protein
MKNFKEANLGKAVKSGWKSIGGKRYYFANYERQKGWKEIKGKKYYLKNGVMVTGLKKISGGYYCFGTNGVMRTGWVKYNGLMAYYTKSGKAGKAGWKPKGDNWYYLKKNGVAKTGFMKLGSDSIFYLDKSKGGLMLTGVHKLSNGKYYFFDEDGRRATTEGWKTFGDYTYYTYKNGTIARNTTINGIKIPADGKVQGSLLDIKASGYSSKTNYLILVNRGEHLVAVFKGKKNNWVKIKGDWRCTIGASDTPTPAGEWTTYGPTGKTEYGWMDFRYTSAAFCTGVSAGFFFHTILYQKGYRGNPYYAPVEDGELGVNHSQSCVRLEPQNAEWVRNNIPSGTKVVVYNS